MITASSDGGPTPEKWRLAIDSKEAGTYLSRGDGRHCVGWGCQFAASPNGAAGSASRGRPTTDAPNDFVIADNVELPWPSARGGMEWEWRIVSLKDIFSEELLTFCIPDRDIGPNDELGGWPNGEGGAASPAGHEPRREAWVRRGNRPMRGRREGESGQSPVGARVSRVPRRPLRLLRGAQGLSGEEETGEEATSFTSMPSPRPPRQSPRPSGDSASRRTGRVRSRLFWARPTPQDQRGSWVRLPERQFPAGLEVGRWVQERLRCCDWDECRRNLRVCLPGALPGLLERSDPVNGVGRGPS